MPQAGSGASKPASARQPGSRRGSGLVLWRTWPSPLQGRDAGQPGTLRELPSTLDGNDTFVCGIEAPFFEQRSLAGREVGEAEQCLVVTAYCDPGCGEQAVRLVSYQNLATHFSRAKLFISLGCASRGYAHEAGKEGEYRAETDQRRTHD